MIFLETRWQSIAVVISHLLLAPQLSSRQQDRLSNQVSSSTHRVHPSTSWKDRQATRSIMRTARRVVSSLHDTSTCMGIHRRCRPISTTSDFRHAMVGDTMMFLPVQSSCRILGGEAVPSREDFRGCCGGGETVRGSIFH